MLYAIRCPVYFGSDPPHAPSPDGTAPAKALLRDNPNSALLKDAAEFQRVKSLSRYCLAPQATASILHLGLHGTENVRAVDPFRFL